MVWDRPQYEEKKDTLTEIDRKIIGRPRILTVPLEDRRLVFEIGDMLAGLGRDMMVNAKRDGVTTREVAAIVSNRIFEVNQRIRHRAAELGIYMPRSARKGSGCHEHHNNESETANVVPIEKPPHPHPRPVRK